MDKDSGLALMTLNLVSREAGFRQSALTASAWHELYQHFSEQQVALHHERQIFGFDANAFHVLRPISLVHWTRTAALNDADEIYAQIKLMGGRTK